MHQEQAKVYTSSSATSLGLFVFSKAAIMSANLLRLYALIISFSNSLYVIVPLCSRKEQKFYKKVMLF